MNNTSKSLSKIRKLITVLRKCNGKSVVGDKNALISPRTARILMYTGLLILAVAIFWGAYLFQPEAALFIEVKSLAQVLMLVLLIVSFVLTVKDVVTVLYTADDLELLLPMPFSASQIVMAKLCVASVTPMILGLFFLNPVCLGFGIRAGAGVRYCIGTVLSSVMIPVTGIAAATLLVVIVFRIFGFIRNRDITVALGGIFTFGLTVAYMVISNRSSDEAAAALNAISSFSRAFPNIFFMNEFMFEGSISGLLISLSVTIFVVLLSVLAVKTFYFDAALTMQNTATKKKAVSDASLHSGKKNSALRALTLYEAKNSRRNPAYLIYGFVMSFVWPVLLVLPIILGDKILGNVETPLGTLPSLLTFIFLGITSSCFSCGFNILPGTAFSREGSSFSAIRALPVDLTDYCRSKRDFSMLVCSLGSIPFLVIIGIICIASGFIFIGNFWVIPVSVVFSFLVDLICVDLMLLRNSKKPRFTWDSETEFSRKLGLINGILVFLGVFTGMISLLFACFGSMLNNSGALIICVAALAVILVLALAINNYTIKTASRNLYRI